MLKSIKAKLRRVPFLVGLWRMLLRWRQQDFKDSVELSGFQLSMLEIMEVYSCKTI